MKSIFRYPGGKTRKSIQKKILSYAPEFDEYREPFVGGGGIFFAISLDKQRWINDIHYGLMSVYMALKADSEGFIARCRDIEPQKLNEPKTSSKPGGKALYNARLKEVFDSLVESRIDTPALSYFFINRTVWAGRVNYAIPSRLYYSNPQGWNIVKTDLLEQASECLKDVEITCEDFERSLLAPGHKTWIYCDSPYFFNNTTNAGSQLYEHCFTQEDHIRLRDTIVKSPHKVCVSYDGNQDFIRDLYKDFNIHEENWTYSGTSSVNGETKRVGKELIVTNY